jgi:hypothetical protein
VSRTWRARGFAIALTAASVVFGPGCAVSVEGSFDEVSFAPSSTAVAILDAHGIVERDGAVNPFERPLADKRVHLWLSGADLPEDEDWQHLADERLLDVKKDLATHDLLVLRDVSFDALADGKDLKADNDDSNGSGDFSFAVSPRVIAGDGDGDGGNGLGGRITVEIEPRNVVAAKRRGGSFEAKVYVKRERAVGQSANNVATGEVVFTLALPFAPERLAEANFAFVAPIAVCGQERGPGANRGCDNVDREPIIDETGSH